MERFALTMKLHKKVALTTVENCGYYIKKVLRAKGTIVKGYCHVVESGEKLVYYWVEDEDGKTHDVAFGIACVFTPEVKNLNFILSKETPNNLSSVQTDEKNDDMYKLYTEDPKKFWTNIKI
jgi:hypothetical protein